MKTEFKMLDLKKKSSVFLGLRRKLKHKKSLLNFD